MASVVISEVWETAGLVKGRQGFVHFFYGLIEGAWYGDGVAGSQVSSEFEEVSGIDMVVDGLLEVEAVGTDLGFGLLQDDLPAAALPAGRIGYLRARHSDSKECYTFSK